jgi:predicted TIM-barrel fold metal-dependent hydrolase
MPSGPNTNMPSSIQMPVFQILLILSYTNSVFSTHNMTAPLPPRIDVHSHFLPPFYHDALVKTGHSKPDGMPAIPPWSTEAHLQMMESANVEKSILSISSPGTHLTPGDSAARKQLTRECNAYAADLKKQHPDKFGFWASLPLPSVDDTLEEIEKAVEEGCDGFGLMTNYHGVYVGHVSFDPVFAKLNELGATVFIHPTTPCIAHAAAPNTTAPSTVTKALPFGNSIPVPIFEFLFDTSRAVVNLFYSGTINRSPNIKFIIPHVGGTLPPLLTRFTTFAGLAEGAVTIDRAVVRRQIEEQFYFDMAGTIFDDDSGRGQLKAFVKGFDISYQKLLYGSDFPFTNTQLAVTLAETMKGGLEQLFDEREREAIYKKNAERLLQQTNFKARF